jgi:hypothetical protein
MTDMILLDKETTSHPLAQFELSPLPFGQEFPRVLLPSTCSETRITTIQSIQGMLKNENPKPFNQFKVC